MPSDDRSGCKGGHKIGYIAVGYAPPDTRDDWTKGGFWYSSEGVFRTSKLARRDLLEFYDVDKNTVFTIKVNLKKPKKGK